MKSFFNKSIAIVLAGMVFFATTSFTVDMHFCGETLIDFSLVHNVKTCGMEKQQPKKDCESGISKKSCCSDHQIMVEGQDNLKIPSNQLTFQQQAFVVAFFYTYINLFEGLDENVVPFRDYTPPYLIRDVQKLHETYLI